MKPALKSALLRYRVMANVVGVLLIVLVLVGVPLKYLTAEHSAPRSSVSGSRPTSAWRTAGST